MFGEAMLSRGPGPEPLTKLNRLGFQTADAPLGKPAIRMKFCALLYLLAVIRGKKKALGVGLQVQHLHSSFTFISTFFLCRFSSPLLLTTIPGCSQSPFAPIADTGSIGELKKTQLF
jgi:hypothetical protein